MDSRIKELERRVESDPDDHEASLKLCAFYEATNPQVEGRALVDWIGATNSSDSGERGLAYAVFSDIGPLALPAVPALVARAALCRFGLQSRESAEIRETLENIGRAAIPLIARELSNKDKLTRQTAADILERYGVTALSSLRAVLRNGTPIAAAYAAELLGALGAAASAAVPGLIIAARSAQERLARMAVEALGKIGDGEALTVLVGALDSASERTRRSAAIALARFGSGAIPSLAKLASSGKTRSRRAAIDALEAMEGEARAAIPTLLAALDDEDWGVRMRAAEALGRAEVASPEVSAGLVAAAADRDENVRLEALLALRRLSLDGPPVLGALTRGLCDEDTMVREVAAQHFARGSRPDLATLKAVLGEPEHRGRKLVPEAALRCRDDPRLAPLLLAALGDEQAPVRKTAARALGELRATSAIEALIAALGDDSPWVRGEAAGALGQLGEGREEVRSALMSLENDDHAWVGQMAAQALSRL